MGISADLTYGIALTDEFGYKLKLVPQELFDFANAFDPYPEDDEEDNLPEDPPDGIVYMPTADNCALVLGVYVPTGLGGLNLSDSSAAQAVHQAFLKALNGLPPDMKALAESMNVEPVLELLCGPN